MKRTRRKFTTSFKMKVVLEAIKERQSLQVLSQKYDIHPNQIPVGARLHRVPNYFTRL